MENTKYDIDDEKLASNPKELSYIKKLKNELKNWENSNDMTQVYIEIYKNRKQIQYKLYESNLIINKYKKQYVASSTFIYVMKKMFHNLNLSDIQWKIITDIGKNKSTDILVNISNFFKLVEIIAKKNMFPNNVRNYNSTKY